MEKRKTNWARYGLAFLMAMVLFFAMHVMAHAGEDENEGTATVKAGKENVRVRASAVDGSEVAHVNGGDSFTVLGSTTGSDGYTWYEISGTAGGNSIRGYIREDFVDVTEATTPDEGADEPEDTQESAPGGEDATPTDTSVLGTILAMDPPVGEDGNEATPPSMPAGFSETEIIVGERQVKAWQKDDVFYLFYATSPSGNVGWFLYDSGEGRWVRYMDFLLEYNASSEATAGGGGVKKGVVIMLAVLVVLLLAACGFLAFRLFSGRDFYDDDDDDDDDYRPAKRTAPSTGSQRPASASPARPAGQGQRPAGQPRPAGQGQRPAGQPRPAGQGQRPAGQPRPAAGQGQRPAGQPRPAGQGQPVRRQSQGGAPVTRRSPQGANGQRPVRQSRPMDDDEE
ncbi:MAG: hypothetical protein K6E50_14090 [Lachnospiraceae bacterium]|nr:hypothetical protein [Lachnospiraceae bacterium]